jgi:hypothetical protein
MNYHDQLLLSYETMSKEELREALKKEEALFKSLPEGDSFSGHVFSERCKRIRQIIEKNYE